MEPRQFDAFVRRLTAGAPRRHLLRWLAGGALAVRAGLAGPPPAAAKRCRKNGEACKRDRQCCSGNCKKKRCRRAPGQADCTIRKNFCAADPKIFICNDNPPCRCYVTTRGTSFCGVNGDGQCAACVSNADCAAITGPGSACVTGDGCCGGGTACFPPCPDPD